MPVIRKLGTRATDLPLLTGLTLELSLINFQLQRKCRDLLKRQVPSEHPHTNRRYGFVHLQHPQTCILEVAENHEPVLSLLENLQE
jgi:hypothetical protein